MPHTGKLTEAEIADLATWIKQGAIWPASATVSKAGKGITPEQRAFWSFQPVKAPEIPAGVNAIDHLVQARLAKAPAKVSALEIMSKPWTISGCGSKGRKGLRRIRPGSLAALSICFKELALLAGSAGAIAFREGPARGPKGYWFAKMPVTTGSRTRQIKDFRVAGRADFAKRGVQ